MGKNTDICDSCSAYHPSKKLHGFLGICETKCKAVGFDQSCPFFTEGSQLWMKEKPAISENKPSQTA